MKLEFEGKEVLIPLFGVPLMTVLIMGAGAVLLFMMLHALGGVRQAGIEVDDASAKIRLDVSARETRIPVCVQPRADPVSIPAIINPILTDETTLPVTVPVTVAVQASDAPVTTTVDIIPTIRHSRLPLSVDPSWLPPPADEVKKWKLKKP
jgi:hypothetical protein